MRTLHSSGFSCTIIIDRFHNYTCITLFYYQIIMCSGLGSDESEASAGYFIGWISSAVLVIVIIASVVVLILLYKKYKKK